MTAPRRHAAVVLLLIAAAAVAGPAGAFPGARPALANPEGLRGTHVPPEPVPPPPDLEAQAALLLDASTGAVLSKLRAADAIAPASLNKLMTLKLVFEALAAGRLARDERVTTPAAATGVGGSRLGLRPGDVLTVDELVRATATGSANDAARALAIHLAGTLEAFVEQMNARAAELGLERTTFKNPDGWDAPGQATTALDMGRLAVAYLRDHPEALVLHAAGSVTVGGVTLRNPNGLVTRGAGVDGLKTGFTAAAGYNLVATAERDGLRLVAVVLGSPSEAARERAALALLELGFREYTAVEVEPGTPAGSWPVRGGRAAAVAAVTAEPWRGIARRTDVAAGVEVTLGAAGAAPGAAGAGPAAAVRAPVRAGMPLGTAGVVAGGRVLGTVAVAARDDVPRAPWWWPLWQWILRLFGRGRTEG